MRASPRPRVRALSIAPGVGTAPALPSSGVGSLLGPFLVLAGIRVEVGPRDVGALLAHARVARLACRIEAPGFIELLLAEHPAEVGACVGGVVPQLGGLLADRDDLDG